MAPAIDREGRPECHSGDGCPERQAQEPDGEADRRPAIHADPSAAGPADSSGRRVESPGVDRAACAGRSSRVTGQALSADGAATTRSAISAMIRPSSKSLGV